MKIGKYFKSFRFESLRAYYHMPVVLSVDSERRFQSNIWP